jgi:hypothetical protein
MKWSMRLLKTSVVLERFSINKLQGKNQSAFGAIR